MCRPLRPKLASLLGPGVAAVVVAALVARADAQIFAGIAPGPASSPAAEAVAGSPVAALRPFPSITGDLKVSGENGDLRWPIYVTEAQSKAALRLRIGFLSAVSVLPDASSLTVSVNDHSIGVQAIDASQGVKAVEFAIPAGALSPGLNAIAVTVQQRHRVDCSVAATYELWTRIDPRHTGLLIPAAAAGIASLDDIPALAPKPGGSMPIHIVLTGKTNPSHIGRLIRATQAIAIAGRFTQPAVDFAAAPGETSGVDLLLGTRAALSKVPRAAGHLGDDGPLATLLPANDTDRATIVVTGSNDAEVDRALDQLADRRTRDGTPAGHLTAANAQGRATSGGEAIRLHDLDLKSQKFGGRFFHQGVDLALPADVLTSDYGRGIFDLAGAYAADLAPGAQVRVDVNGMSAGLIKLPDRGGDVFRHNQLFLPLRLMRPGLNHIDIYAETPRLEDASCAAPPTRRFLFLDDSVLELPTLARVLRLPDLAAATAGGLPFAKGHAHLVVPKPDRDTVAAALSLTARAAVAAGKPISFSFSTGTTTEDGSTLIVSPARALDPDVMRRAGVDPAAVEAAWQNLTPLADDKTPPAPGLPSRWWLANSDAPLACRLPVRTTDAAAAPKYAPPPAPRTQETPAAGGNDDLLASWSDDAPGPTWRDRFSAASMRAMAWVDSLGPALPWKRPSTDEGIAPGASLILAQGFNTRSGTDVTTIVTAPDSTTLREAVGCLFDPSVWPAIHGRIATVDATSGRVRATDATQFRYAASDTASLRNTRLVAAGWLSLNPIAFVIIALILAAVLSGTTPLFVRRIGRRSE